MPMVALNRGERREYPRVVIEREPPKDLKMLSEVYDTLSGLGLPIRVDDVYQRFDIEKPEDGDDLLERPAPPPGMPPRPGMPPGEDETGMARALAVALGQTRPGAVADAIDVAVAQATGDWQPLMDPMVQPVLAAARDALADGNLERFRADLPALLGQMDATALARLVRNMTFSAELSGRTIPGDGET